MNPARPYTDWCYAGFMGVIRRVRIKVYKTISSRDNVYAWNGMDIDQSGLLWFMQQDRGGEFQVNPVIDEPITIKTTQSWGNAICNKMPLIGWVWVGI